MPTPYNLAIQDHCTECGVVNGTSFCSMLSPESLSHLERIKFTSVYPKGSVLFVEGEMPRGVFVLCNGRAKLSTSSRDGKTLIVKIAESGELLGASATMLGRVYEVTAETIEPSQLNFVRRDDFIQFLEAHPDACMHAAEQLSAKYQDAQREIRSLGLPHTTSEKLARLLLDWCEHGEQTPLGVRLKVTLTHEEIAQMIGTTRETVTRLLSDYKRRKMIEVKGSTILVMRPDQMHEMISV